MSDLLALDWPVPDCVGSAITSRQGGASTNPYACNNLALHVDDNASDVQKNRDALVRALQLPVNPQWLEQVHGTTIVEAKADNLVRTADGCMTQTLGLACAVLTADCLPILISDKRGQQVAAVHAGWRGLAQGILPKVVSCFSAKPCDLRVYLGPAISFKHFEVGVEVLEGFFASVDSNAHSDAVSNAFIPSNKPLRFFADLPALARASLTSVGVTSVYGGDCCTYADTTRFYSYRRDGITGRMASLIWRKQ